MAQTTLKLTKAQARQLEIIRAAGQVIETFNGRRTWTRSESGLTSPVIRQLVRAGLVVVSSSERDPNTFATITRLEISPEGLAVLQA